MFQLKPIVSISLDDLYRIVPGYSSSTALKVKKVEDSAKTIFTLATVALELPFTKKHDYSDPSILADYNKILSEGHSFGAFVEEQLIGFIIGEHQNWNDTMVIREFGVAPEERLKGIGRALFAESQHLAKGLNLRGILCETQSTNGPAILFYQGMGFTITGIDTSLYSNSDLPRGEVAVFLRKALC